jgi:hypothetical protein
VRNAYRVWWGPEAMKSLKRPRYREGVNIKMDLKNIGWEGTD